MIRDYFNNIVFASPEWLPGLLLIPLITAWYWSRKGNLKGSMKVSSMSSFQLPVSWKVRWRHLPFILRMLTLALLILALARPQHRFTEESKEGEGIDIMLCMDVSGSMAAQDFVPNRLEASKQMATKFIDRRPTDRIGLVVFSGEPFTQCPVTSDHEMLKTLVYQATGRFLVAGTAIGSGLAMSVDRLKSSKTKSKVVILLTDGENNGGLIDPLTAKDIAKTLDVKVYTIGMGTEGFALVPDLEQGGDAMRREKVNIDEVLLTKIANETGGKYFRAKENEGLEKIYGEIDRLEKSKITVTNNRRSTERFYPLALAALALLFLEFLLRNTLFRTVT